jgi:hypothetical protein
VFEGSSEVSIEKVCKLPVFRQPIPHAAVPSAMRVKLVVFTIPFSGS